MSLLSDYQKKIMTVTTRPAYMLNKRDRIFTNINGVDESDLQSCMKRGDWNDTQKIIANGKKYILDEVRKSELRGRSGAGLLTYKKWEEILTSKQLPHYLCINGNESEPGTCKDRQILQNEPQKIIEGAFLASYALDVHRCYVYVRGHYTKEAKRLQLAIDEAKKANLIGKNNKFGWDFEINVHPGAGAYVCGEQTGLMTSLEGNPGTPRQKPPQPFEKGLFQCPTVVDNVETISTISSICRRGGKWFSSLGIPGSRGPKIYQISGHVNRPCIVEETLGMSLKELIDVHGSGVRGGWDNLQCIIPGGTSCPPITKEQAKNAILGFDEMSKIGSGLGTGSLVVIDNTADIVEVYRRIANFYKDECCGQCKQCVEGTETMAEIFDKIARGKGTKEDVKHLEEVAFGMKKYICSFSVGASDPIRGFLKVFKNKLLERCIH